MKTAIIMMVIIIIHVYIRRVIIMPGKVKVDVRALNRLLIPPL